MARPIKMVTGFFMAEESDLEVISLNINA